VSGDTAVPTTAVDDAALAGSGWVGVTAPSALAPVPPLPHPAHDSSGGGSGESSGRDVGAQFGGYDPTFTGSDSGASSSDDDDGVPVAERALLTASSGDARLALSSDAFARWATAAQADDVTDLVVAPPS
jgi:hypothetical protein